MQIIDAEAIGRALTYETLVDALAEAFRGDITVPVRHHHTIPQAGADGTLLLMPAWTGAGEKYVGCKIVTVFPENAKAGKPAVYGQYLLSSGETGEPLALIEGKALTAWRTGCASALAARYLAREDSAHLLMVGAGALAPHLVRAHKAVRPITRVSLWNRSRARAVATGFGLTATGVEVEIVEDLEAAAREADIISCATLATEPLIQGAWLKAGTHVDLVGGFTPKMRETDDAAIRKAHVFVDTRDGALKEAGDLVSPIRRKVMKKTDVKADLFDLCGGKHKGRRSAREITLFKSVGTAIEDLAAAMLVWKGLK